jgi:DnaD/phage-associated family protein
MKITDKNTKKVFVMPKIEYQYLNRAKKAELKLLYYIFQNGGEIDVKSAASDLEETEQSILSSLAFLRGAGIINDEEEEKNEKKTKKGVVITPKDVKNGSGALGRTSYTVKELAFARENDKNFSSLVSYFEKLTGHLYNSAEQGIIMYLYDTLGMNYDVIMGVAQYCASLGKTSVRYIERTAENINEKGITTYAELENYLGAEKRRNDYEEKVKKIIGASDRALTKSEKTHIALWEEKFNSSMELVSYAYDKTISKINKPQISYMSKILESWHENGLETPEEVDGYYKENEDEKKNKKSGDGKLDFDMNDFFEKPDRT